MSLLRGNHGSYPIFENIFGIPMKIFLFCIFYMFFAKGTLKRAVMNQTWYCNNARPYRYCQYSCYYWLLIDAWLEIQHARICACVHGKKLGAKKDSFIYF